MRQLAPLGVGGVRWPARPLSPLKGKSRPEWFCNIIMVIEGMKFHLLIVQEQIQHHLIPVYLRNELL